jgi:hypothetical protein
MPNGWDPIAGFPAMAGNVPFLAKDVVLLAVSFYLLKQDVMRASLSARKAADTRTAAAGVADASLTAPNLTKSWVGHDFVAIGLRPFARANMGHSSRGWPMDRMAAMETFVRVAPLRIAVGAARLEQIAVECFQKASRAPPLPAVAPRMSCNPLTVIAHSLR